MNYSIFKDNTPKKTINIIKNKLNDLNIPVEEIILERKIQVNDAPISVRLNAFSDFSIGTNGKGTNELNALASAYGEFMERLENQTLPFLSPAGFDFLYAPDEIICNINNLQNNIVIKHFLNFEDFKKFDGTIRSKEKLEERKNKNIFNTNKTVLIPFYGVYDKKIHNLPINTIRYLQGTNGMSAGNTLEEALVQGLSEICERYSMKCIIKNNTAIPEIQEEDYIKYERIKKLIEYCKNNGYDVSVKDASLGKNIPSVCTIFEKKDENIIIPVFGAHPSLPIAIERTITEFLQGRDISSVYDLSEYYIDNNLFQDIEKNKNLIFEKLFFKLVVFKNNNYLKEQFNQSKKSYQYDKNTWINLEQKIDNKCLLEFLLKRITSITKDIYVRDSSFLGFPSIYVYIPEMSVIFDSCIENINESVNYSNWVNIEECDLKENWKESLYKAIDYSKRYNLPFLDNSIEPEFIKLLAAISKRDYKNFKKSQKILFSKKNYIETLDNNELVCLKIIGRLLELEEKDNKEVFNTLKKEFNEQDIKCAYDFLNEINYENIRELIIMNQKKANVPFNKIILAKKNLYKKYKENVPNLKNLNKLFTEINFN